MFNSGSNDKQLCPLLNKPCIEGKCKFWSHILGVNPQTGAEVDQFNCVVSFLPMLLIENSKMQRETGAAVESFRNEVVKQGTIALTLAAGVTQDQPRLVSRG